MTGADGGVGRDAGPGWRWDVALSFSGAQRDAEVSATATIDISGMGLTGVLRMTWVQDHLAHVLDHSQADETSGTWTGLACPTYGLPLSADVDNAMLRRRPPTGRSPTSSGEAPDEHGSHSRWTRELAPVHHLVPRPLCEPARR
jgi:hypothetical protein